MNHPWSVVDDRLRPKVYGAGMRLMFRPLEGWPREKTRYPDRCPFRSTWTQTLHLLEREIEMLRDRGQRQDEVLIQVDAPESAMRLDGGLRADARVGFQDRKSVV